MKKIVNARPLAAIALSQISGIFLAAFTPALGVWARIIPLIVVSVVGGTVTLFVKGTFKRIFCCSVACCCIALTFVGGASVVNRANKIAAARTDGEYLVTGVVRYSSFVGGKYNVRLTDCRSDGKKCGDIAINGIKEKLELYDCVSVQCVLQSPEISENGRYTNYVFNNVALVADSYRELKKTGVKVCLPYKFRNFVSEKLVGIDESARATAFALVCGDTTRMKNEVELFRATGIAHVFAVSGLHVGLLCALLSLIFRPIPVHRAIKGVIISCLLVLYSFVCGFSASSLRAAIMCATYLLTSASYEKKDRLSALSLASIVALIANPFDLFGAGYVLSFSLSLSMIALAPAVAAKIKSQSEGFTGAVSTLVSAEAAAIPLSVKYFGSFPLASVIGNLVVVPSVTAAFYALAAGLALSVVVPPAVALYVAGALLAGTEYFASLLAKINLSATFFPDALAVAYFAALFIASDLVNAGKTVKRFAAMFCVAAVAVSLFASYVV